MLGSWRLRPMKKSLNPTVPRMHEDQWKFYLKSNFTSESQIWWLAPQIYLSFLYSPRCHTLQQASYKQEGMSGNCWTMRAPSRRNAHLSSNPTTNDAIYKLPESSDVQVYRYNDVAKSDEASKTDWRKGLSSPDECSCYQDKLMDELTWIAFMWDGQVGLIKEGQHRIEL